MKKISSQSDLEGAQALHQVQIGLRALASSIMDVGKEVDMPHNPHMGPQGLMPPQPPIKIEAAQVCVHVGPKHEFFHVDENSAEHVASGFFAVADAIRDVIKAKYGIEYKEMDEINERHEQKIAAAAMVSGAAPTSGGDVSG